MFFYIITVIYNQLIKDSPVANNIDKELHTEFIFVDNSTRDEICRLNSDFCNEKRFTYISMHGNSGLPKAYNSAISGIAKNDDNWIIICDQDTELEAEFLQYYKNSILSNPEKKIFCPIINDAQGIMSPAKIKGKKYSHSEKIDFNKHIEGYSFINSCMCINSTVFNAVQYDEKLFLDCVDHDFVKVVRRAFDKNLFYVIPDLMVFQNFSFVSNNSFESDLARFRIYLNDARYFYSKWYKELKTINISLLVRACVLTLRHKNLIFIRLFFDKNTKLSD